MDRSVRRRDPTDWVFHVPPHREEKALRAEPKPDLADRSQFLEFRKDRVDGADHGFIGWEANFAVAFPPYEAHGQAATQFAASRFVANSSLESRAQDVKFCLRHDAFQAENQAIVEKRRMIDAVAISHQSIGDATQIEQAIPVGIVACQARDFQSEHDSRAAHSNFCSQVREAGALDPSRTRPAQIFIDDDHLFSGPAQLADFFHQVILASGGLAVVLGLRGAGLTDVDIGAALDMIRFYFARIIHGSSPKLLDAIRRRRRTMNDASKVKPN